jgi:hypothetical protein
VAIANTNEVTGVRYGIVALRSLEDWVFDEFFNNGTNVSYEAALKEFDGDPEDFEYEGDEDTYEMVTPDGLELGLSTLGGAYNVWVFESPHTAEHALCSPCVPNAGNIDTPGDFVCYTLSAEWFRKDA